MVHSALEAARTLADACVSAEVHRLEDAAAARYGRRLRRPCRRPIVRWLRIEAVRNGGVGAEIAARIGAELFFRRARRAGAARGLRLWAPIPFAPELERALLPGSADIVRAVREELRR